MMKLKAYAMMIGAATLTFLAFIARIAFLKNKAEKLQVRAESAELQANHALAVSRADNEIEEQVTSRRVNALNEIRQNNTSTELSDPNKLWVDKDDSDKE